MWSHPFDLKLFYFLHDCIRYTLLIYLEVKEWEQTPPITGEGFEALLLLDVDWTWCCCFFIILVTKTTTKWARPLISKAMAITPFMWVTTAVTHLFQAICRFVSLEVSFDACTGGDSQYYFYINFHFCLVILYIWILVCFLPRNISMEADLSCESAWNKLQKLADTFPYYLGSMLV